MKRWISKDGIVRNPSGLRPRERQVLELIAEGTCTKRQAGLLHLSHKTVEYHRAQIMKKVRIFDVAGLTRLALWWGLVPLTNPQMQHGP